MLDVGYDSTYRLFKGLDGKAPALLVKANTIGQAIQSKWPLRYIYRAERVGTSQFLYRLAFPPGWFSTLAQPAKSLLAFAIERKARALKLRPALFGISYPQYHSIVRSLGPRRFFYYCIDDYREFWPDRAKHVEEIENQTIRAADLIVCVSRFMAEDFSRRVPEAQGRIFHLPNGAREEFLVREPLEGPAPLPADVAHIPRPVLGYLGSIGGRINWDLVTAILQGFPNASVLFIGPPPSRKSADHDRLQRAAARHNFHYLGYRPQEKICDYIRAFDVCLIPEPYHALNVAGCPQKFWNYLASSRPIVSTAIPEQSVWKPAVAIGDDVTEFLHHIDRLLSANGHDGLAARRLAIAREHTWPRLANRLWEKFRELGLVDH